MKKRRYAFLFLVIAIFALAENSATLPKGFVYLKDLAPNIETELRYFSDNNFIGRPIKGYEANVCIMTKETAFALAKVQEELTEVGLSLKIFDAYRPQRAVDDFVAWAKGLEDTKMKKQYYPRENKATLFKHGYIASRSGHSRGSTVDLTIVTSSGEELDMGSPYDFFGPESWDDNKTLNLAQQSNRIQLRHLMMKHGFTPYPKEWWHFKLKNEPFSQTYFDFLIQ